MGEDRPSYPQSWPVRSSPVIIGRVATDDPHALAEAVKKRRLELHLARKIAAESVGMSKDTWKRVEDGDPVRDLAYAKIEKVLGWETGSCRIILAGGSPIPAGTEPDREVEYAPVPAEMLEDEVRQAVTNAMVGGTDLTADKIRAVNEAAIRVLRERGVLPPTE